MLLSYDDFISEGKSRRSVDQAITDLLVLFMMRSFIPDYVLGRYNDSPFYITHPDLHNRNIVIEGCPVPEEPLHTPPLAPRARGFTGTGDHPIVVQTATAFARGRVSSPVEKMEKPDYLKVVGIIDWDAAHPIPLQAAAIMPKFLETLPGAEFPDLPIDYVEPDLRQEKEMFLEILGEKEMQQNRNNLVSDLVRNGSWKRDLFTVALRRGDVRTKWLQWWTKQQLSRRRSASYEREYAWTQRDLKNMCHGAQEFLAKADNHRAIATEGTSSLMWRIVLELERLEEAAIDACWADCVSAEMEVMKGQLQKCVI